MIGISQIERWFDLAFYIFVISIYINIITLLFGFYWFCSGGFN